MSRDKIKCIVPLFDVEYFVIKHSYASANLASGATNTAGSVAGYVPRECLVGAGVRIPEPERRSPEGNDYDAIWINREQSDALHAHRHWVTPERFAAAR